MKTQVLHCFAGKRWSGDATSALNSALKLGGAVLTEGSEDIVDRLHRSGIKDVRRLGMSGWFGALNLSRMLRLASPDIVYVYSPQILTKVNQAVALAKLPVKVEDYSGKVCLPKVSFVELGEKLIWIGYITADCGLRVLLETIKDIPALKLRVVGVGEAKVVGPLLNMSKSPQLRSRVEWAGEKDNVYEQMNGCRAGVITSDNPEKKVVYEEYANAGLPVICGTTVEQIKQGISSLI